MTKKKSLTIVYILPFIALAVCEFLYHRATPFMMDDLWYSTNLATDEPLHSFHDILQGQVWHYLNWGGRSITHTVLQAVLMGGELFADIMNLLMTILLSLVIASFTENKENRLFAFSGAFSLLVCLNASIQYSMFWQAGAVNYVYSTVWILTFLRVYLREFDENCKPLPLITLWIIPLGLVTGWSNENMGPASFAATLLIMFMLKRKKKLSRFPWWMSLGSAASLIGSILVIVAPGNFKRSEFTGEGGLLATLASRALSMLTGACSYLLPSIILVIILSFVSIYLLRIPVKARDMILIITAFLAYGAMILSPHFPARASFGIMAICIVIILSYLEQITKRYQNFRYVSALFLVSTYVYSIIEVYLSAIG